MIDLYRFFRNPFLAPHISMSDLQSFTEDHLARLVAANTDGRYNDSITGITSAFGAYFGQLASLSLRTATQRAATQSMNTRWLEFVKYMTTRGEARVKDRAGKPSEIYTEFYPRGLTEYHLMNISDGQTLARRVKESVANHAELLGEDFRATVTALADGYLEAREAQMDRKGTLADSRGERDELKAVLQERLFGSLLTLASEFKDPAKCPLFFNQSLIDRPEPPPQEAKPQP